MQVSWSGYVKLTVNSLWPYAVAVGSRLHSLWNDTTFNFSSLVFCPSAYQLERKVHTVLQPSILF